MALACHRQISCALAVYIHLLAAVPSDIVLLVLCKSYRELSDSVMAVIPGYTFAFFATLVSRI